MSVVAAKLPSSTPSIGLEVRAGDAMMPVELAALERAGLHDAAAAEAWIATGSTRQLAYASHGIFRFFGKFPPPIASHLISTYTEPGDLVIDPMCGSGTSGVEALLAGRGAFLSDVNPLALLLASVKTRSVSTQAVADRAAEIVKSYCPLTTSQDPFEPIGLRSPDHWFLPETAESLRGIRHLVETVPDERVRDALRVAFAATVRRASRATTQQGRLFLDSDTALPSAIAHFAKRATIVVEGLRWLEEIRDEARIAVGDLRTTQHGEQAPLVILHPPYFNAYRYSSINSLELAWLGIPHAQTRKREVREFFKVGHRANAPRYVDDMVCVLDNAADLVAPEGHLALMIGDTQLQGQYVPVVRELLARMRAPLSLTRVAVRVPRFTEATWVASQRRTREQVRVPLFDFVLIFQRR
jgi:DNA methylase